MVAYEPKPYESRTRFGVSRKASGDASVESTKWARLDDPDARWIVRENLRKARLAKADPAETERLRATVAAAAALSGRRGATRDT